MKFSKVFLAIWARKWQLCVFSAGISLVFGLVLYFLPRAYSAEIQYAFRLNAPLLQKVLDRFYSDENRSRLLKKFDENQLAKASELLLRAEDPTDVEEFLQIRVTPNYIDYSQKRNMKLSFERTWAENIEKLEKLTAEFLVLKIDGIPKEEMEKAIPLIRHNLEQQLPLYGVQDDWILGLLNNRQMLANYDGNRQNMALDLEQLENTLAKMKAIPANQKHQDNFQLQINVDPKDTEGHFLPLSLQIQGYESKVAEKKEHILDEKRRYELHLKYDAVLSRMLTMIETQIQDHGNLDHLLADLKTFQMEQPSDIAREYLSSHIRILENTILEQRPLTDGATISPVAKGTISKTGFAFVILLMLGIFIIALDDFAKAQSVEEARA